MLKIKDDVDLKELEKFGFINNINNIWFKEVANSDENYSTSILVNPTNAVVKNQLVHYTDNVEELEELKENYIDLTSELDVVYDLIKADLVEKVNDFK